VSKLIRSVYILGQEDDVVFSKEYARSESKSDLVEFLVNLAQFLKSVDLEGQTEFMNVSISRIFYAQRDMFTFVFIADKADDTVQIEDKMTQLVDTFMNEFANLATAKQPLDGFDAKVDEIAVTMVKVAILGFAGVGKTTTLHLLRGETLPLVHDPTIGVSIKRIGIANKQDLPTALTPERVGQILAIPTYELVAIDISYRDRMIQIIRKAILEGKAEIKAA